MRLRYITEVRLSGSRNAIRDAGKALGDLIEFIYSLGDTPESQALDNYLKSPNTRGWQRVQWVIDSAMQKASEMNDPTLTDRMKQWASLNTLTAPVVTAAIYDVDPEAAKGTPLQKVALSRQLRDKAKLAMGPQGYVGALANANKVPPSRLKAMLKDTAKSGKALAKASKRDLPGVKPVARF